MSTSYFISNLHRLEKSLLPTPTSVRKGYNILHENSASLIAKVTSAVANFFTFIVYSTLIPFTATYSLFFEKKRNIERIPEFNSGDYGLPDDVGFSDSHFQTIGFGTRACPLENFKEGSNWDKWLNPSRIEGTEDGKYESFFTDIISKKGRSQFIKYLKDMNVTAYRFSLEWSVIQPSPNWFNMEAIRLYQDFIEELMANGIKPYVTLHHFVHTQWFEDLGGFSKIKNVEVFVNYAKEVVKHFPKVKNWMTFNEPGIFAFQSYIRGVYPPGIVGNIPLAGKVARNLMIAHTELYKSLKKDNPNLEVGITHQWLKFEPLGGNFIERIVCYFLSKITHYAVYNFFKNGVFSFQIPFLANIKYSIPKKEFKKNNGYMDWIGVQFYGFPKLKVGFNKGIKYPGNKVTNLIWRGFGITAGTTCKPDNHMMSFGPSYDPNSLVKALNEAKALGHPIVVSEIGADANVWGSGDSNFRLDNKAQRDYYEKVLTILEGFKLKAVFFWTWVRGHLEWDLGKTSRLGVTDITRKNGVMDTYKLSSAATLLKNTFAMVSNKKSSRGAAA